LEKFLNKMERSIGRHPIRHLMRYICALYIFGLILHYTNPEFYQNYLSLDPSAIIHGQIWRIFTFLIEAPDTNVFLFIFVVYLYYMIGETLENTWGSFKFNVYYFTGVIFTILGSFLAYFISGNVYVMDTYYLNMSLFLAFAFIYPDTELLFMFLIPVKIKWLAYIDMAYFAFIIITAPDMGTRISAALAVMNFVIFFFGFMRKKKISPAQFKRQQAYAKAVKKPQNSSISKHRCAVCGRTSESNPELEFRFCSKCNGNYEYCQDHLFTHEHIK